MVTGERQAARIRGLYLKAILRQDIAFFDKEMTTGQVVERMSGDTILIQDAIGEKVRKTSKTCSYTTKRTKRAAFPSFYATSIYKKLRKFFSGENA